MDPTKRLHLRRHGLQLLCRVATAQRSHEPGDCPEHLRGVRLHLDERLVLRERLIDGIHLKARHCHVPVVEGPLLPGYHHAPPREDEGLGGSRLERGCEAADHAGEPRIAGAFEVVRSFLRPRCAGWQPASCSHEQVQLGATIPRDGA